MSATVPREASRALACPERLTVSLTVNGQQRALILDSRTTLLDALRDHLHLTGSKKGCGCWRQRCANRSRPSQCDYCTPGQILSAIACVHEGKANDATSIREYMSGNLCRCGAYPHIVTATEAASRKMATEA